VSRWTSRSELLAQPGALWDELATHLPASAAAGPAVVAGLGLGHVFVALWNLNRETGRFGVEGGPFVAFVLTVAFGGLICAAGYGLWQSPFTAEERWLVAATSVAGSLVTGSVLVATMLVRLSEGRVVSEPVFVLTVTSAQGVLAGAVAGALYTRAVRSADEARRRRDQFEFLSSVFRHDVLNSMTVVRSRADALAARTEGRNSEFAETILDHAANVVKLAERVSSMYTAMSAPGTIERSPIALAEIVDRQVDPYRSSHPDISFEVAVGDHRVLADDLLEDVLGNLVGNAVEHGSRGDGDLTVSVTAEQAGNKVRIRVADTGPGVPDDMKGAVFERETSRTNGGFGLFFVDTMVDHYGGDVWVEDSDSGGAAFVVELDAA